MTTENDNPDTQVHTPGVYGPPTGNMGRPVGAKNKYALESRNKFKELGFDVLDEYVALYRECKQEIEDNPKLSNAKASLRSTQNNIMKELMPYAFRKMPDSLEVDNASDMPLTIITYSPKTSDE